MPKLPSAAPSQYPRRLSRVCKAATARPRSPNSSMVTGLCDGGAVCRGVLALGGVADLGGAVCDGRALEDGRAAEDRGALEDGGVFSGGGAVLLVVAIGAACGCGAAPDAPLVM